MPCHNRNSLVECSDVTFNKNFDLPLTKNNNRLRLFSSSLELRAGVEYRQFSETELSNSNNPRPLPEYLHIRTRRDGNDNEYDINQEGNIVDYLEREQLQSLHYLDFSGDGYVQVKTIQGGKNLNNYLKIAAYSIIAPPDFFPYCSQTDLFDDKTLSGIWETPPEALCDVRMPPNIQSYPELFYTGMSKYDTCTALVSSINTENALQTNIGYFSDDISQTTYLSDGASGIFAPGWDTSYDVLLNGLESIPHLAAYGLGSPFPEDAKLCAALSSFWPAVAPDISQSFWSLRPRKIVLPLTVTELGDNNNVGWDGETGPILNDIGDTVSYKNFEKVDYTLNTLNNLFDYNRLSHINTTEYKRRIKSLDIAKKELDKRVHSSSSYRLIRYNIEDINADRQDIFTFVLLNETTATPVLENRTRVDIIDFKTISVDLGYNIIENN